MLTRYKHCKNNRRGITHVEHFSRWFWRIYRFCFSLFPRSFYQLHFSTKCISIRHAQRQHTGLSYHWYTQRIGRPRIALSATTRLFLFTGILGGFTTFSTFSLDTLTLFEADSAGGLLLAVIYVVIHVVFGLIAVYLGHWFTQLL